MTSMTADKARADDTLDNYHPLFLGVKIMRLNVTFVQHTAVLQSAGHDS